MNARVELSKIQSDRKDNFEKIKEILKKLAESHSQDPRSVEDECKFNLKVLTKDVLALDYFRSLDIHDASKAVDNLQANIDSLFSIESKCLMLKAYEALKAIFLYSSEDFRLKHFQELINFHFHLVSESWKGQKFRFEHAVKYLLPLVKLEILSKCTRAHDSEDLSRNLANFFKYPRLNQEDIYEIIRNKFGPSTFTLDSFQLIPLGETNGFLGEYFNLKITAQVQETVQNLDLFAKFLVSKTATLQGLVAAGASKKEEFFYMTYLPLLKNHGLGPMLDFTVTCYFSRVNDVLVLDDLVSQGFVALPQNSCLEYSTLVKVLEQMAKFHASAMILEEIVSEETGKKTTMHDLFEEYVREVFFVTEEDFAMKPSDDATRATMRHLFTIFPDVARNMSEDDIANLMEVAWKSLFNKVKRSERFKNTLCHGDMHVANLLYKFRSDDGVCVDAKLIDFQILRYCPPAQDLLLVLWQNTTKATRTRHINELCQTYYDTLAANLKRFGYEISQIYPKSDFEASLKYMKPQAVVQALYYSFVTKIPGELKRRLFASKEMAEYYLYQCRWRLVDLAMEDEVFRTELKALFEELVKLYEKGDL